MADTPVIADDVVVVTVNEDDTHAFVFEQLTGSSIVASSMRAAVVVFIQTIFTYIKQFAPCKITIKWRIVEAEGSSSIDSTISVSGNNIPDNSEKATSIENKLCDLYEQTLSVFRLPSIRRGTAAVKQKKTLQIEDAVQEDNTRQETRRV